MALKEIVHRTAKNIAELTSPDYMPPRRDLTLNEKQHLIRLKAKLEASTKSLAGLIDFYQATQRELTGYKIPAVDLSAQAATLKTVQREVDQQAKRLAGVLAAGGIPVSDSPAPGGGASLS